ncbi:MAG: SoxR reducing system RseC family protein [SAR324 cluster bacterium]|nr:SoxR reducing system RseC family protein [SAR324 cluster bacterium]
MEIGFVTKLEGAFAWVKLQESNSCHSCGAKDVCRPGEDGSKDLKVDNPVGACVGMQVSVAEKGRVTLKISFLQFGLPLLSLLLGMGLTSYLPQPDGWPLELVQSLYGFCTMFISGVISWTWANSLANDGPLFTIVENRSGF